MRRFVHAVALLLLVAQPGFAQQVADSTEVTAGVSGTRPLTLDDYGAWRRIGGAGLSPDGRWATFTYSPNDGSGVLHVRNLDNDSTFSATGGNGAVFSEDSRWVAYLVSATSTGAGRGGAGAGSPGGASTRKLQLRDLRNGSTVDLPGTESFAFSADSKYLAVKRVRPPQSGGGPGSGGNGAGRGGTQNADQFEGTDLIVRELATGEMRNIGSVTQYAFNESGRLLAYLVDASGGIGNGLFVLDPSSGVTTALHSSVGKYDRLSWHDNGTDLAALHGFVLDSLTQRDNRLLVYRGIGTRGMSGYELDPDSVSGFPESHVLSELAALSWSKDGGRLFFGIKEQTPVRDSGSAPRANVDVWHWADSPVQSVQAVRRNQTLRATQEAVWILDSARFVRLEDDVMSNVSLTADGRWGIGRVDTAYRYDITWGGSPADYYRINVFTGERTPIISGLTRSMGTSPDSRWFLYLEKGQVIAMDVASMSRLNLSTIAGVNFVEEEDDHPYEKPTYGVAGWSRDGRAVLLNHRYDIYSVPLDTARGRVVNLTGGVGDSLSIRFRLVQLNEDSDDGVDVSRTLLLSAFGEWTKQSGYFELRPGRKPSPLLFEDASIGSLSKAEKADRLLYSRQTFTEFGDYWVAGANFTAPRRITDANPQLSEFAWGSKVLIDYTNSKGQRLQGTLTLPAGYEPGRRYPMLVYFYEKMSDQHHRFSMPVFDDRPHMSTYASNGYLVLQPDVVYETGRPGSSAVDCVTAAVRKVIELGYADPAHIGLQGHSWGGYQSSYILTQTDMFAAVVTGAPVTNLVSFYNELYKSSGNVQQGITEVGQVRMGVGFFEDPELYRSQSPLHNAENISTPFLILHGTDDGSVDWHQGLEFYNAARRLGKQVILLSYPGEGHHLGRKENQVDFQVRMRAFFDHYLKGAPAPEWMAGPAGGG